MSLDVEALADLLMDLRMDGPAADGWTYQQTMRHYAERILARLVPAEDEGRLLRRIHAFLSGMARAGDNDGRAEAAGDLIAQIDAVLAEDEGRLREAAQRVMDSHRQGYWNADEFDALDRALAATPEPRP